MSDEKQDFSQVAAELEQAIWAHDRTRSMSLLETLRELHIASQRREAPSPQGVREAPFPTGRI